MDIRREGNVNDEFKMGRIPSVTDVYVKKNLQKSFHF